MKKISYAGKNTEDLKKTLMEKRKALRDINFGIAGSKAKNVKEGREIRKEIARIMTELNKPVKE